MYLLLITSELNEMSQEYRVTGNYRIFTFVAFPPSPTPIKNTTTTAVQNSEVKATFALLNTWP